MLLEGLCQPPDMETIMGDMPLKSVCDRLIFTYFNSVEAIAGQCIPES